MNAQQIQWQTRKAPDGRLAKQATIMLAGVGRAMGGRRSAHVQIALAEQAPDGAAKWAMSWRWDGRTSPVSATGEAACLDTAEFMVEEAIPEFAEKVAKFCRDYDGRTDVEIAFTGWRIAGI